MFRQECGAVGAAPAGGGGAVVARERSPGYATGPADGEGAAADAGGDAGDAGPSLGEALALVQRAQAALAAVDLGGEDDRVVMDAAVGLAGVANRLAGQQLRVLGEVDRRQAYAHDGAVTTASWYRTRVGADEAGASRLVKAAVRLAHFPALRSALEDGAVSLAHVTAVTDAAVPTRRAALAAADATLAGLARAASPRQVRRAVAAIRDHADRDGADDPPAPPAEEGPDERRYLSLRPTVDGLLDVRGMLDPLAGEALVALVDAVDTPDAADTPEDQRRSAGQRRADALDHGVRLALASRQAPAVAGGVGSHILASIDLLDLLGLTETGNHQPAGGPGGAAAGAAGAPPPDASRPPRLRYTGETTPAVLRRLAYEAKITAVVTMGPWRMRNRRREAPEAKN